MTEIERRGIILAGGSGGRLSPMTKYTSKHLLPVYDKPMIYYPLATLMSLKIQKVCIVVPSAHHRQFQDLLGDGSQFGIEITYRLQSESLGTAHAFGLTSKFCYEEPVAVVCGDNIHWGINLFRNLEVAQEYFNKIVCFKDRHNRQDSSVMVPTGRANGVKMIHEKPHNKGIGSSCVTGLYLLRADAVLKARKIPVGPRGEFEIADVINSYTSVDQVGYYQLEPNEVWFDCGTAKRLHEAACWVETTQERLGRSICDPGSISRANNWT